MAARGIGQLACGCPAPPLPSRQSAHRPSHSAPARAAIGSAHSASAASTSDSLTTTRSRANAPAAFSAANLWPRSTQITLATLALS
eukprot:scaffold20361_cov102-Isochrysis_galbana.AAC.8